MSIVVPSQVAEPVVATPSTAIATAPLSVSEALSALPKTTVVGGAAIPDYIKAGPVEGLDESSEMALPRLRVVQQLSTALKDAGFSEGDVVIVPLNVKVGNVSSPLDVVCLLKWTEFLCLNPRGAQGVNWIRDRSLDKTNDVARKAEGRVTEPMPEGQRDSKGRPLEIEYVKVSNFLLWLNDHNIAVVYSAMKGEARHGVAFNTLITARNVSIYSSIYRATCSERTNQGGDKWYGLSFGNSPVNSGWVPPDIMPSMRGLWTHYNNLHKSQMLNTTYDEPEAPAAGPVSSEV